MTKILVIRFRRVGDAVLTSAICTTLKQSIPDAKVHYVLNENIAPLFENHPDIDKLITFTEQETHSFFRYIRKIRRIMKNEKYDIIIDARTTLNTLFFSLFSLGSKYRIGRKKGYASLVHNYQVDNFDWSKDDVELMLQLTDPLNKDYSIHKNHNFRLYSTDEEKTSFANYMTTLGIDFSQPIIVCAVTARLVYKRWGKEDMKATLQRILDKYANAQLIFNYGGSIEKDFAQQMYDEMGQHPRIFMNVEAKGLRELLAMLNNASFFFGNEGGPRHISQALNIPSFAIYPPNTSISVWLPNRYNRFQGIAPEDVNASIGNDSDKSFEERFALISVDEVWKRLDPMLKKYIL